MWIDLKLTAHQPDTYTTGLHRDIVIIAIIIIIVYYYYNHHLKIKFSNLWYNYFNILCFSLFLCVDI